MLKIRLARGGSKKRPYYYIVIADAKAPRDGRFIEKVGTYNPMLKKDDPTRVTLKLESITEWLKKGAQPTDRVARFLSKESLVEWKHGNNPKKGTPHKKAQERAAEKVKREADRLEAEAAAKAEALEAAEAEKLAAIEAAEAAKAAAAAEKLAAKAAAEAPVVPEVLPEPETEDAAVAPEVNPEENPEETQAEAAPTEDTPSA